MKRLIVWSAITVLVFASLVLWVAVFYIPHAPEPISAILYGEFVFQYPYQSKGWHAAFPGAGSCATSPMHEGFDSAEGFPVAILEVGSEPRYFRAYNNYSWGRESQRRLEETLKMLHEIGVDYRFALAIDLSGNRMSPRYMYGLFIEVGGMDKIIEYYNTH
jgi:hypothetical protein